MSATAQAKAITKVSLNEQLAQLREMVHEERWPEAKRTTFADPHPMAVDYLRQSLAKAGWPRYAWPALVHEKADVTSAWLTPKQAQASLREALHNWSKLDERAARLWLELHPTVICRYKSGPDLLVARVRFRQPPKRYTDLFGQPRIDGELKTQGWWMRPFQGLDLPFEVMERARSFGVREVDVDPWRSGAKVVLRGNEWGA